MGEMGDIAVGVVKAGGGKAGAAAVTEGAAGMIEEGVPAIGKEGVGAVVVGNPWDGGSEKKLWF